MSTLLEDKIKAIMKGSQDKESDKELKDTKTGEEEEEGGGEADKDAKDDNDSVETGEPVVGKGKKDKAEVKEEVVPGIGKDLKTIGPDTAASSDNAKIQAGKDRKLGSKDSLKDKVSADPQDDNGDNAKIKAGEKNKEKGGKLSANEHFDALFNGEELSEKFKSKAEAIFETAITTIAEERIEALEEEYKVKLEEAVEEVKGKLVEQIDGYLDFIVEQWIDDNAVALESGMKVELVNSFIDGMKNLFQEHYIDIPENKLDIVEEQARKIEELEAQATNLKEEKEEAVREVLVIQCEEVVSNLINGLTAIEEEKFRSLTENVEFEDLEEFESKAKTIRESYFKNSGEKNNSQDVTKVTAVTEDNSKVNAVLQALQKGKLNFVRN